MPSPFWRLFGHHGDETQQTAQPHLKQNQPTIKNKKQKCHHYHHKKAMQFLLKREWCRQTPKAWKVRLIAVTTVGKYPEGGDFVCLFAPAQAVSSAAIESIKVYM